MEVGRFGDVFDARQRAEGQRVEPNGYTKILTSETQEVINSGVENICVEDFFCGVWPGRRRGQHRCILIVVKMIAGQTSNKLSYLSPESP